MGFREKRTLVVLVLVFWMITMFLGFRGVAIKNFEEKNERKLETPKLCQNGEGLFKQKHYIVAATLLKNQRRYVREWIEFHKMMGISHFIIYDNYSSDKIDAVLAPYIEDCSVTYQLWPPTNHTKYLTPLRHPTFHDEKMMSSIRSRLQGCWERTFTTKHERIHKQAYCQTVAFEDAILRTRGAARWMGTIDVDEYYYPSPSRTSTPNPLVSIFKENEGWGAIQVVGQIFGTSGFLSPARRGDEDSFSSLLTKSHQYRSSFIGGPHTNPYYNYNPKTFVDPLLASESSVHYFSGNFTTKIMSPTDSPNGFQENTDLIYQNHFQYLSRIETFKKSKANQNGGLKFNSTKDSFNNQVHDNRIQYLIPALEERLTLSMNTHRSSDGMSDDYDPSLFINKSSMTHTAKLRIHLKDPQRLGLVRFALTQAIQFMKTVEPSMGYLLVMDPFLNPKFNDEIKREFPLDEFAPDFNLPVLIISEEDFMNWEIWEEGKVLSRSLSLFDANQDVSQIIFAKTRETKSDARTMKEDPSFQMENASHNLNQPILLRNPSSIGKTAAFIPEINIPLFEKYNQRIELYRKRPSEPGYFLDVTSVFQ